MADLNITIASVFAGKKAFLDATKQTLSLNSQVKNLAKSYAGLFTAQRLARSGFNAAKAFAEDDKAARVLGQTLSNLGLGFGNNAQIVNDYISNLERQTGVLDDELRPAMDRLLRATGDITKSQELLSLALDISAGTGKSVAQVTQSLQKAYLGQTQALGRLGVGLSKAELTSSSFEKIQKRLTTLFEGQAALAAETYIGKMNRLTVASNNAKETIGKDLIDALTLLSGDTSVEGVATDMENFAKFTGDAIYGVGVLASKLNNLPVLGEIGWRGLLQAIPLIGGYLNLLADAGSSAKAGKNTFNFASGGGAGASDLSRVTAQQTKKAEELRLKRARELAALTAKNTKAIKEQVALQKAGTIFDKEQTQIVAALKGQISADERKRLELQLALITGNTSEASKLAGEIGKAQGLSQGLINFLKDLPDANNPFKGWKSYLDAIEAQVKRIAMGGTAMGTSVGGSIAGGSMTGAIPGSTQVYPGDFGSNGAVGQEVSVVINVEGSVTSEGELVDKVRNGLINSSLSGAGSLVARRTGTFATL